MACLCLLLFSSTPSVSGFAPSANRPVGSNYHVEASTKSTLSQDHRLITTHSSSKTALNVWWFGGSAENTYDENDESCELVAVRIEKTSANSRRIMGDITVESPLADVWAILTDYDRLAVHVPNLMESKQVGNTRRSGEPGDGQYKCRLFQKGSQKIIGFDFSASVTMDMVEKISTSAAERSIGFKCVESQFFSEFDGEWKAVETIGADGQPSTTVSYLVDVRPKGPVPVAALEWRIREDVPSNLRAVKRAAVDVGEAGVLASRVPKKGIPTRQKVAELTGDIQRNAQRNAQTVRAIVGQSISPAPVLIPAPIRVYEQNWERTETMEKYL